MKTYNITAFEKNGDKLLDESFQAENDAEAKRIGEKLIKEKSLDEKIFRCTSPVGKLILFQA